MKKIIILALILLSFTTKGGLLDNSIFATKEKAKQLLTTPDEFTNHWSQFDINSRLHKKNGTKKKLFKYIAKQALNWSEEEKSEIAKTLKSIDGNISDSGLKINFPGEIYFIKTTAKEEGNAEGYTRANYIVLRQGVFAMPAGELKNIIIHELFHVLSRADKGFRSKMYKLIGFTVINEIPYPDKIKDLRITNPDAPLTDSYITLKKDSTSIDCAMILYANKAYEDGDFFKYLKVGLLQLQDSVNKEVKYAEGDPVIYSLKQISNFYEQTGKNTGYIINPEEILADNFTYTITNKPDLPSQWVVDDMRKLLKE